MAESKTKRTNIKTTNQTKLNKPNNAQNTIGANKAKRDAKMAVKRGMLSSAESAPMDVEREVYRQFYGGQKTGKDTATRISGRVLAR